MTLYKWRGEGGARLLIAVALLKASHPISFAKKIFLLRMLRPQKSSGLKLNLFSFTIAYGGCVHLGFAWIGDLMPSLGISSHAKTMT